jgi:hypothetical protein
VAKKIQPVLTPLQKVLSTKVTLLELLENTSRAGEFDGILNAAAKKLGIPSELKKEVSEAFTVTAPFKLRTAEEVKASQTEPESDPKF